MHVTQYVQHEYEEENSDRDNDDNNSSNNKNGIWAMVQRKVSGGNKWANNIRSIKMNTINEIERVNASKFVCVYVVCIPYTFRLKILLFSHVSSSSDSFVFCCSLQGRANRFIQMSISVIRGLENKTKRHSKSPSIDLHCNLFDCESKLTVIFAHFLENKNKNRNWDREAWNN